MRTSTFILFLLPCLVLPLPTPSTTNQDEEEEKHKNLTVVEPFEMNNPSHVNGDKLYQSDILLTDRQWDALKNRKAVPNENYRWTEGSDGYPLVPYLFQDSVNKTDVRAAVNHWMEHTCIKFEETNNTDQPHIQFHIGVRCWSKLGMLYYQNGQQLSIGNNCNKLAIVVHEIGHAIGWWHEQARSDRDNYVQIFEKNIEDDYVSQFQRYVDNNYSVPYDYSSVMHYGEAYWASYDKPSIMTLDPWAQELIGSRIGLSHRDKLLANRMYNCTGKWLSECGISSDPCLNDGYIGKNCTCICPYGTGGSNCEDIIDDYYDYVRNPLSEKITTEKKISVKAMLGTGGEGRLTKWIIPPAGKRAKVIFTHGNLEEGNCEYQFLRIKTDDSKLIGQVFCKEDVKIGLTLTSDTGIFIFMKNSYRYTFVKHFWDADVTFENITDPTTTQATVDQSTTLSESASNNKKKFQVGGLQHIYNRIIENIHWD